jgi:Mn-dependent DtxR family transcriptional regulator
MSTINKSWKEYDEVELTHSAAHYLMAITELHKTQGYVRAVDIANYLDLTRGSVSTALSKLEDKDLITADSNKFYQLTSSGEEAVNGVLSKRRIIIRFLTEILQLNPKDAEMDACKIEHLLSQKTGERMMTFLGFYLSNSASAEQFRKEFQQFMYTCDSASDCHICENRCFFHA